jgi:cell division protease FtsH
MIRECYQRAKNILAERRDQLELLAQTLLVRETLNEEQIKSLLETGKIADPPEDVKVNIQRKEAEQKLDPTETTSDSASDQAPDQDKPVQ